MSLEFIKPTIEEVHELIQKELKDISLESLNIHPREHIDIQPIYNSAPTNVQVPLSLNYRILYQLVHLEKLDVLNLNQQILNYLIDGQNGVILNFKSQNWALSDITQLFKDIRLDYIHIECINLTPTSKNSILAYIEQYPHKTEWSNLWLSDEVYCISEENFIKEAAHFISNFKGLKASIHIELSGNYFWDIAKIRAFKTLLFNHTRLDNKASHFIIIGETTLSNKSSEKLENNILKLTTEAMSAMIAGCEGIWIKPFDNRYDHDFSLRISRNIFHLMQEESYIHLIKDSSSGSYFIENYTEQIAKQIYLEL